MKASVHTTSHSGGAPPERAVRIGPEPYLWAMLHYPFGPDGSLLTHTDSAVVFCSPFAEEEKCSRRLYTDLSRSLARCGIASIRFSYRGTCDSQGAFSTFSVAGALDDVERAGEICLAEFGAASLALFGLRLGATLALQAAPRLPRVHRVALWAPIINGRSYVRMNFRRQAIRKMITTGDASSNAPATTASPPDLFDFDGYPVAASLWSELEGLTAHPPKDWAGETLIFSVGPGEKPSSESTGLHQQFIATGIDSELQTVICQPFWNLLGLVDCPELLERTASWLARPVSPGSSERLGVSCD